MKPLKPLFMKTYGKQRRKLSAWISPENRKQAFDSTFSTDGDISVFEPSKPTRIRERKASVASRRATHQHAKKQAMLYLTEKSLDEDSLPSPHCPQPAQQNKTTRKKKTSASSEAAVRPSKRKARLPLTETSSDEENITRPSPPQPAQQSNTSSRKSRLVSVPGLARKRQKSSRNSESDEDSASTAQCQKSLLKMNTDSKKVISCVHLPSAGRFVTRRRRAIVTKPKLPKAAFRTLNSSDEFTSAAPGSGRVLRPSLRRRRERVTPAFLVSSAENSVNAAGTASFATNPLRELSLNELADSNLRLCPRKPIFCSTPSAGPFSNQPRLKPLSINDQSGTPPSMSVSSIGVLSTSQEDSPRKLVSPPYSAAPIGSQSSFGEEQPSGDLFVEVESANKRSSCGKEAKSHSQDIKTKSGGDLSSLNLLSTDDSESSSRFVSAAGGLEWLIEALKEKCLTDRCTVQLERLYNLTEAQVCGQTPYSSCLANSDSIRNQLTNEHPLSVDTVPSIDLSQSSDASFTLHLSVTNNKTSGSFQSENSIDSSDHGASVSNSQSTDHSPSIDCEEPVEQSASVLLVESTHHADDSVEIIMDTQLPARRPAQALFTDNEAVVVKNTGLNKKCTVQLQKLASSQATVQHLRGFMQQKEADLPRNENTDDPEDVTHSGEITEKMQCNDLETGERAAALTAMLKEGCISDKPVVKIKRLTLPQVKEVLQPKGREVKSPTVSDSDGQTKNHHQSESDTNHSNEDTSASKGPTSSEDKISSDKEEVVKNSYNIPHKRKKTSLAPKEKKRRSTSTDRPGTTRKACVSGLSVSRWKNKDAHVLRGRTPQAGGNKTVDCSINDFISTQHKQPKEVFGSATNFSTPLRVSRLNLSSLLADFTPSTHTWSRIKAALSVHRKGIVLQTPKSSSSRVPGSPVRAELTDVSQDLFATPFRSSLPKRFQSQLLDCDSVVEGEDADLSDAEKVYAECGQQHPLPWEECILPQRMKRCVKIGEGTFGEVFSTTNASGETVALKIIPVEGSEQVNGEDQKTLGEILHEIIISKELSSLKETEQQNQTHGFIGLNDLHCVRGYYPPDFLKAWDKFNQQKGSENDRPDFFEEDQLFIILEFEFGGIDLENSNGTLASLGVAKSILHQVTAALAVAEQKLHFEHRDLHWGNVLVKPTKEKKGSFLLNGAARSLETKGVLVRIIDYSLSRLEIDDLTVSCDISKDEELFMGQGDYQFDIYRLMRQENGNNWSNYHPHTNVLWLHYLCSKLLSMKYRSSGGKGAKDTREALTRFYDNVLEYSSAMEVLQNCPMFQ